MLKSGHLKRDKLISPENLRELKMIFFNYWTKKYLFFVYPYFTLDVNTWYDMIQILSEIKNLTFLNFKNSLNSFKMLSLLFCFYLFNLGFLQIRLFHNIVCGTLVSFWIFNVGISSGDLTTLLRSGSKWPKDQIF